MTIITLYILIRVFVILGDIDVSFHHHARQIETVSGEVHRIFEGVSGIIVSHGLYVFSCVVLGVVKQKGIVGMRSDIDMGRILAFCILDGFLEAIEEVPFDIVVAVDRIVEAESQERSCID